MLRRLLMPLMMPLSAVCRHADAATRRHMPTIILIFADAAMLFICRYAAAMPATLLLMMLPLLLLAAATRLIIMLRR